MRYNEVEQALFDQGFEYLPDQHLWRHPKTKWHLTIEQFEALDTDRVAVWLNKHASILSQAVRNQAQTKQNHAGVIRYLAEQGKAVI